MNPLDVETGFMLHAMQEWGDSDEQKIAAVQALLDAAGFEAKATCWPVFGRIWPKPCTGKDAVAAGSWLRNLTNTMPRGKFETEVEHIEKLVAQRKGESRGK